MTQTIKILDELEGKKSAISASVALWLNLKIQKLLEEKTVITLDFDGVKMVNEKFFEESIGKLYEGYTGEFLRQHLKIVNLKKSDFNLMAQVLKLAKTTCTKTFDHEKLYPAINKQVKTSRGNGVLWQVFPDRVAVVLNNQPEPKIVRFFTQPKELQEISIC